VPPPPDIDPGDLESLALLLRRRRQELDRTIRSSQEYWAGVRHVLELRAALERAEGRFRELYDFIPVPFLVLDGALRIASANAAAVALCGPGQITLGQRLQSLLDADDFRWLAALLAGGGLPSLVEVCLRTAKGELLVQMTA
jgi:PAS domain-containing protein